MQVVHPVAKLATNASGAIWWPNLQPIQEVSLKSIWNYSSWDIYSSYELNTLGPLCLWQCLKDFFWKLCQKSFESLSCKWSFKASLLLLLNGNLGYKYKSRGKAMSGSFSLLMWSLQNPSKPKPEENQGNEGPLPQVIEFLRKECKIKLLVPLNIFLCDPCKHIFQFFRFTYKINTCKSFVQCIWDF